jgi:hypothetical protein
MPARVTCPVDGFVAYANPKPAANAFVVDDAGRVLLARRAAEPSVTVSIVRTTALENEDGTWTLTVHADEDQIAALEALGHTVRVVESDASLLARGQEIEVEEPPVS